MIVESPLDPGGDGKEGKKKSTGRRPEIKYQKKGEWKKKQDPRRVLKSPPHFSPVSGGGG